MSEIAQFFENSVYPVGILRYREYLVLTRDKIIQRSSVILIQT